MTLRTVVPTGHGSPTHPTLAVALYLVMTRVLCGDYVQAARECQQAVKDTAYSK